MKNALRDRHRASKMGARQNHQELIAAKARDYVHLTHRATDGVGNEAHDVVASFASAGVIVSLQAIDIHDEARQWIVVALGPLELFAETSVQIAVVVQARQVVVQAELLQ